MKSIIFCQTNDYGKHSFYLRFAGSTYFLFTQDYRKGVQGYFGDGVRLNAAFDYSRNRGDSAITRTMYKIPMYIKYIEKEYEIEVLEQTKKKNGNRNAYRFETAKCA